MASSLDTSRTRRALHLLPHPGGGAETYVDLLFDMPGWRHERHVLSPSRSPARAALAAPERLRRLVKSAGPHDVVHVHGDAAALMALPVFRRRSGVMTTHGLHLLRRQQGVPGRIVTAQIRRSMEASRCVICTSATEREEVSSIFGGKLDDRLVVVRNGIDPVEPPSRHARQEVRAELGLEPDDVVAVFLGELEPRKDPLAAVFAVEQVAAAGSRLRIVIAGDGPLMQEVRAAAGPATRVVGFRDDAGRLLEASDIFILPSQREGASFALLEAMGRGLAIVVSDGEGNAELAEGAGVVFPFGDVNALRSRLASLAEDPAERERLGYAARSRVASELTRTQMVEGVRRVYERVTAPGPAALGASASGVPA